MKSGCVSYLPNPGLAIIAPVECWSASIDDGVELWIPKNAVMSDGLSRNDRGLISHAAKNGDPVGELGIVTNGSRAGYTISNGS